MVQKSLYNQLNSLSHCFTRVSKTSQLVGVGMSLRFCFPQLWALQPCFSATKLSSPTSTNRSVPLSHDVRRGRGETHRVFSPWKIVALSSEETSEFKQENIWTYDIHCSDLLQNLPSSKSKQIFCWSCETLKNHQTSDAYQRYLWIM